MDLNKKYQLKIPEEFLRWVHPELRSRQLEISNKWDESLLDLGWLCEVEGPKVLTAEEIWLSIAKRNDSVEKESFFYLGFKNGDKNGQLQEWLRLKPLIDLCEYMVRNGNVIFAQAKSSNTLQKLKKELEKLTNN